MVHRGPNDAPVAARLALPLYLAAGAFVVAAGANVLLIVGGARHHYPDEFVSAYSLGLVSDLVIAAALIVAATVVRGRS